MTDDAKPTHALRVFLITGQSIQETYTPTYSEGDFGTLVEGVQLSPKTIELFKKDGTHLVFERERVLFHSTFPQKDLPETVKNRIELARNLPGRRVN